MTTITHFRSAVLAVIALMLSGCTMPDPAVDKAREQIAATLPAPYFEDLVTESVATSGKRLVFIVRSPEGDADKTRENPDFELLRQSEQDEMRELCTLPAIHPLIETDVILVRRFVDRRDKVFFEVALPARECAGASSTHGNDAYAPPDSTQRSDP